MQNILALDLGTKTGYAYNFNEEFFAGTWTLATDKELKAIRQPRLDRRRDPRVITLFRTLASEIGPWVRPEIVVFEDVQFASYTGQVQLWASLRAAVWLAFDAPVNIECVPVGTLKKFATGHGGATKDSMANYLKAQHPECYRPALDDNAVDAAWLWIWAKERLCFQPKRSILRTA